MDKFLRGLSWLLGALSLLPAYLVLVSLDAAAGAGAGGMGGVDGPGPGLLLFAGIGTSGILAVFAFLVSLVGWLRLPKPRSSWRILEMVLVSSFIPVITVLALAGYVRW